MALAAALAVTSLPSATSWASPSVQSTRAEDLTVRIPESLGTVQDAWQPPDGAASHLVIHIQDLHTHPQAQRQTAALIEYLHDHLGVSVVALEGAEGLVDPSPYTDLPDPPSTERIARLFVDEGLFSGADYYAIKHPGQVTLWGVDQHDMHAQHLAESQAAEQSAATTGSEWAHLREALRARRNSRYPATVRKLIALREAFERDAQSGAMLSYVRELLRLARQTGVDLRRYPSLQSAFATGAARQHAVPGNVRLDQLDAELEQLGDAIEHALLPKPEDRLLSSTLKQISILEELALTRLSPAHEAVWRAHPDDFSADQLWRNLVQVFIPSPQPRAPSPEPFFIPALSPQPSAPFTRIQLDELINGLAAAQRYYQFAHARDALLARDLVEQLETRHERVAILITGGFHTPGITQRLREQGIAYAVITPHVTEPFDEDLYRRRLDGEIPSLESLRAKLNRQALAVTEALYSQPLLARFLELKQGFVNLLPTLPTWFANHRTHALLAGLTLAQLFEALTELGVSEAHATEAAPASEPIYQLLDTALRSASPWVAVWLNVLWRGYRQFNPSRHWTLQHYFKPSLLTKEEMFYNGLGVKLFKRPVKWAWDLLLPWEFRGGFRSPKVLQHLIQVTEPGGKGGNHLLLPAGLLGHGTTGFSLEPTVLTLVLLGLGLLLVATVAISMIASNGGGASRRETSVRGWVKVVAGLMITAVLGLLMVRPWAPKPEQPVVPGQPTTASTPASTIGWRAVEPVGHAQRTIPSLPQSPAPESRPPAEVIAEVIHDVNTNPNSLLNRPMLPLDQITDPVAHQFAVSLSYIRGLLAILEAERAKSGGDPKAAVPFASALLVLCQAGMVESPEANPSLGDVSVQHPWYGSDYQLSTELASRAQSALEEVLPALEGDLRNEAVGLLDTSHYLLGSIFAKQESKSSEGYVSVIPSTGLLPIAGLLGSRVDAGSLWRAERDQFIARQKELMEHADAEDTRVLEQSIIDSARRLSDEIEDERELQRGQERAYAAYAWQLEHLYGDPTEAAKIRKEAQSLFGSTEQPPTPEPSPVLTEPTVPTAAFPSMTSQVGPTPASTLATPSVAVEHVTPSPIGAGSAHMFLPFSGWLGQGVGGLSLDPVTLGLGLLGVVGLLAAVFLIVRTLWSREPTNQSASDASTSVASRPYQITGPSMVIVGGTVLALIGSLAWFGAGSLWGAFIVGVGAALIILATTLRFVPVARHKVISTIIACAIALLPMSAAISQRVLHFQYNLQLSGAVFNRRAPPTLANSTRTLELLQRLLDHIQNTTPGQLSSVETFNYLRETIWKFNQLSSLRDASIEEVQHALPGIETTLQNPNLISVPSVSLRARINELRVAVADNLFAFTYYIMTPEQRASYPEIVKAVAEILLNLQSYHEELPQPDELFTRYFPTLNQDDVLGAMVRVAALRQFKGMAARCELEASPVLRQLGQELRAKLGVMREETEESIGQVLALEALIAEVGTPEEIQQELEASRVRGRGAAHHIPLAWARAVEELRRLPPFIRTAILESAEAHRIPKWLLVYSLFKAQELNSSYSIHNGIFLLQQRGVISPESKVWLYERIPTVLAQYTLDPRINSFLGGLVGGKTKMGLMKIRPIWVRRYKAWERFGVDADRLSNAEITWRLLDPQYNIEAAAALWRGAVQDVKRFKESAIHGVVPDTSSFEAEANESQRWMYDPKIVRYCPDSDVLSPDDWISVVYHPQAAWFIPSSQNLFGYWALIESAGLFDDKPAEFIDINILRDHGELETLSHSRDPYLRTAAQHALVQFEGFTPHYKAGQRAHVLLPLGWIGQGVGGAWLDHLPTLGLVLLGAGLLVVVLVYRQGWFERTAYSSPTARASRVSSSRWITGLTLPSLRWMMPWWRQRSLPSLNVDPVLRPDLRKSGWVAESTNSVGAGVPGTTDEINASSTSSPSTLTTTAGRTLLPDRLVNGKETSTTSPRVSPALTPAARPEASRALPQASPETGSWGSARPDAPHPAWTAPPRGSSPTRVGVPRGADAGAASSAPVQRWLQWLSSWWVSLAKVYATTVSPVNQRLSPEPRAPSFRSWPHAAHLLPLVPLLLIPLASLFGLADLHASTLPVTSLLFAGTTHSSDDMGDRPSMAAELNDLRQRRRRLVRTLRQWQVPQATTNGIDLRLRQMIAALERNPTHTRYDAFLERGAWQVSDALMPALFDVANHLRHAQPNGQHLRALAELFRQLSAMGIPLPEPVQVDRWARKESEGQSTAPMHEDSRQAGQLDVRMVRRFRLALDRLALGTVEEIDTSPRRRLLRYRLSADGNPVRGQVRYDLDQRRGVARIVSDLRGLPGIGLALALEFVRGHPGIDIIENSRVRPTGGRQFIATMEQTGILVPIGQRGRVKAWQLDHQLIGRYETEARTRAPILRRQESGRRKVIPLPGVELVLVVAVISIMLLRAMLMPLTPHEGSEMVSAFAAVIGSLRVRGDPRLQGFAWHEQRTVPPMSQEGRVDEASRLIREHHQQNALVRTRQTTPGGNGAAPAAKGARKPPLRRETSVTARSSDRKAPLRKGAAQTVGAPRKSQQPPQLDIPRVMPTEVEPAMEASQRIISLMLEELSTVRQSPIAESDPRLARTLDRILNVYADREELPDYWIEGDMPMGALPLLEKLTERFPQLVPMAQYICMRSADDIRPLALSVATIRARLEEPQERAKGLSEDEEWLLVAARDAGVLTEIVRDSFILAVERLALDVARKKTDDEKMDKTMVDDLAQGALLQLLRLGVPRYDPSRGKWSTYAHWWLRQARDRVLSQEYPSGLRLPVHIENRISYLRQATRQVKLEGVDPSSPEGERLLAERLEWSVEEVRKVRAAQRTMDMDSLDRKVNPHDSRDAATLGDILPDVRSAEAQERARQLDRIASVIGRLPLLDAVILYLRDWRKWELEKIGSVFGMSRERVNQIETRSLNWLEAELLANEEGNGSRRGGQGAHLQPRRRGPKKPTRFAEDWLTVERTAKVALEVWQLARDVKTLKPLHKVIRTLKRQSSVAGHADPVWPTPRQVSVALRAERVNLGLGWEESEELVQLLLTLHQLRDETMWPYEEGRATHRDGEKLLRRRERTKRQDKSLNNQLYSVAGIGALDIPSLAAKLNVNHVWGVIVVGLLVFMMVVGVVGPTRTFWSRVRRVITSVLVSALVVSGLPLSPGRFSAALAEPTVSVGPVRIGGEYGAGLQVTIPFGEPEAEGSAGSGESLTWPQRIGLIGLLGVGTYAAQEGAEDLRPVLFGDMLSATAMAGWGAWRHDRNLFDSALLGAGSGLLIFSGKRLTVDLIDEPGYVSLLGKPLHALGVSMRDNLLFGRAPLSHIETDFGPLLIGFDPSSSEPFTVSLLPGSALVLGQSLAAGHTFDLDGTLHTGALTFQGDPGTDGASGVALAGLTDANIITLAPYLKHGTLEYRQVLGHEFGHTAQYEEADVLGVLPDAWLHEPRLGSFALPQWFSLSRDFGVRLFHLSDLFEEDHDQRFGELMPTALELHYVSHHLHTPSVTTNLPGYRRVSARGAKGPQGGSIVTSVIIGLAVAVAALLLLPWLAHGGLGIPALLIGSITSFSGPGGQDLSARTSVEGLRQLVEDERYAGARFAPWRARAIRELIRRGELRVLDEMAPIFMALNGDERRLKELRDAAGEAISATMRLDEPKPRRRPPAAGTRARRDYDEFGIARTARGRRQAIAAYQGALNAFFAEADGLRVATADAGRVEVRVVAVGGSLLQGQPRLGRLADSHVSRRHAADVYDTEKAFHRVGRVNQLDLREWPSNVAIQIAYHADQPLTSSDLRAIDDVLKTIISVLFEHYGVYLQTYDQTPPGAVPIERLLGNKLRRRLAPLVSSRRVSAERSATSAHMVFGVPLAGLGTASLGGWEWMALAGLLVALLIREGALPQSMQKIGGSENANALKWIKLKEIGVSGDEVGDSTRHRAFEKDVILGVSAGVDADGGSDHQRITLDERQQALDFGGLEQHAQRRPSQHLQQLAERFGGEDGRESAVQERGVHAARDLALQEGADEHVRINDGPQHAGESRSVARAPVRTPGGSRVPTTDAAQSAGASSARGVPTAPGASPVPAFGSSAASQPHPNDSTADQPAVPLAFLKAQPPLFPLAHAPSNLKHTVVPQPGQVGRQLPLPPSPELPHSNTPPDGPDSMHMALAGLGAASLGGWEWAVLAGLLLAVPMIGIFGRNGAIQQVRDAIGRVANWVQAAWSGRRAPAVDEIVRQMEEQLEVLRHLKARQPWNSIEFQRERFKIACLQLQLLSAAGVLSKSRRVFAPLSGLGGLFAEPFSQELWTLDKDWSVHALEEGYQRFWEGQPHWLNVDPHEWLAPTAGFGAIHHQQHDVLDRPFMTQWLQQMRPGDVLLLRYVREYLRVNPAEGRAWLQDMFHAIPEGVIVVILENPDPHLKIFGDVLENRIADEVRETYMFEDLLPQLVASGFDQRITAVSGHELLYDPFEADAPGWPSEGPGYVGLAGQLSVFRKKRSAPLAEPESGPQSSRTHWTTTLHLTGGALLHTSLSSEEATTTPEKRRVIRKMDDGSLRRVERIPGEIWSTMRLQDFHRDTSLEVVNLHLDVDLVQSVLAQAAQRAQAGHVRPVFTVLDLMAGSGRALNELEEVFRQPEIAEQLRRYGVERVRLIGHDYERAVEWEEAPPNLEFIWDDIFNLSSGFEAGEIDLVYSRAGLMYLSDEAYRDFLDQLRSRLSPDATIYDMGRSLPTDLIGYQAQLADPAFPKGPFRLILDHSAVQGTQPEPLPAPAPAAGAVKVRIPTTLQRFTDGAEEVRVNGATVGAIIEDLERKFPGIKGRLVDESGRLSRFVTIYVNGDDIRFLDQLDTPIKDGDEIAIAPALAGGAPTNEEEIARQRAAMTRFRVAVETAIASSDDMQVDQALASFEQAVREGLHAGRIQNADAAAALLQLNEEQLRPHGYLVEQSPRGLSDERAFVLYKARPGRTQSRQTDQESDDTYYVDQVTRFSDGLLRGNPGWCPWRTDYVVVFSQLLEHLDLQRVQPTLGGAQPFTPKGTLTDRQQRHQIEKMAELSAMFMQCGLGWLTPEERLLVQEQAVASHEVEHERRRRLLHKPARLTQPGLEEELAELRSMMEEEPFHVLAHVIGLAAAGTAYAWSILGRLTALPPSAREQILAQLEARAKAPQSYLQTLQLLRAVVTAAYQAAEDEWKGVHAEQLAQQVGAELDRPFLIEKPGEQSPSLIDVLGPEAVTWSNDNATSIQPERENRKSEAKPINAASREHPFVEEQMWPIWLRLLIILGAGLVLYFFGESLLFSKAAYSQIMTQPDMQQVVPADHSFSLLGPLAALVSIAALGWGVFHMLRTSRTAADSAGTSAATTPPAPAAGGPPALGSRPEAEGNRSKPSDASGQEPSVSSEVAGPGQAETPAVAVSRRVLAAIAQEGIQSARDQVRAGKSLGGSVDYDPDIFGTEATPGIDIFTNVITPNLGTSIQEVARMSLYQRESGLLQVAMERSTDTRRDLLHMAQDELEKLLADRARYSVIFLIDPARLGQGDHEYFERTKGWFHGGGGPMLFAGPIPPEAIVGVVASNAFEGMIREFFPSRRIIIVSDNIQEQLDIYRWVSERPGMRGLVPRTVTLILPNYERVIVSLLEEQMQLPYQERGLVLHASRLLAPSDVEFENAVEGPAPADEQSATARGSTRGGRREDHEHHALAPSSVGEAFDHTSGGYHEQKAGLLGPRRLDDISGDRTFASRGRARGPRGGPTKKSPDLPAPAAEEKKEK